MIKCYKCNKEINIPIICDIYVMLDMDHINTINKRTHSRDSRSKLFQCCPECTKVFNEQPMRKTIMELLT